MESVLLEQAMIGGGVFCFAVALIFVIFFVIIMFSRLSRPKGYRNKETYKSPQYKDFE